MTRNDLARALKSAIVDELRLEGIRPEDIDDNAPLFGDGGLSLDSLDAVELVVLVEKHFNVAIEDTAATRVAFVSINGLVDFICARQQSS